MKKKIFCFTMTLVMTLTVPSFLSISQEEEEDGWENGGVKQQWFWHECELSRPNKECRIVESTSKCGKPAKKRPSGTC
ncbi:hypothetical protein MM236_16165 [Belliella sp. DSM 107340]|uniref:Uncharacterized protein n=1 Tax=Belliella calami TaxID=2923436 RepID=A0ABS9USF9_9BACT|nr:hypothetical protein [Belliella calami]MCH7399539.1 hypothetical protein [Belliella calami]